MHCPSYSGCVHVYLQSKVTIGIKHLLALAPVRQRNLAARKEKMTAAQSSCEALRIAARAAEEKQGIQLFAVDASDAMGLIDGFLVVSAHNERLVNAVADEIEDALREQADLKPVRREGRASGRWILLDFGDIVVHVQHEEDREFYALDRLWAQAPRIALGVTHEVPFDLEGESEEEASRIVPADE